ncbi:MAG: hypothetical protein JWO32_1355, partial [Bacteroidetes bacterium]|nr:hypothetical protein [Bacteroidota bacterium]
MKNYRFILKPLFFIFNLLFATWLVLKIEKIEPSDFGEYKSIFYKGAMPKMVTQKDKQYLKNLCSEYKNGKIDSLKLEKQLEDF